MTCSAIAVMGNLNATCAANLAGMLHNFALNSNSGNEPLSLVWIFRTDGMVPARSAVRLQELP